jgi:membrane protein DedA with SNARE-associated domain
MLLVWSHIHLAWQLPAWLQTPDWYRPLARFILHFIRLNQAVGLFGVIFVEELGIPLPVPGDVAIAWAGYLTSRAEIAQWQAVLAVVAGATLGSTCLYTLSRRFGHPFVLRFGRYVGLNQETFLRAETSFKRWGPWAIILGRHIPGMRIYLSALAGLFEVRALVFIPCVIVSSTAWALIFVTVGRLLGRQSGRLARLIPAHLLPYAVGLIVIVGFVLVARAHGWQPFRHSGPGDAEKPAETAASKTPAELHKT